MAVVISGCLVSWVGWCFPCSDDLRLLVLVVLLCVWIVNLCVA